MLPIVISSLEIGADDVEIVERKGLGHPDTICDGLAETFSRNLCREYRQRFDCILHHNVDKALLCGGRATPEFGGGTVLVPIAIYLAGRAVTAFGGERIPIDEIAVEGSRTWLRENLHGLDASKHVQIRQIVQSGSKDLQDLFIHSADQIPLANDTSIGVGYAPLSKLEQLVLSVERRINAPDRVQPRPAWGEDVKVMGLRHNGKVVLTIACALIGRHLAHMDDYLSEKSAIERLAADDASRHGFPDCEIHVNAADQPSSGSVYLTVTGTSAEAGDDGEVGRGNRSNGLITPCRPMSLEAVAGKNPVTHVGKIYNVVARRIAEATIREIPEIRRAQCLMVSRIGAPITSPAIIELKIATREGRLDDRLKARLGEIAGDHLASMLNLVDDFISGKIELF